MRMSFNNIIINIYSFYYKYTSQENVGLSYKTIYFFYVVVLIFVIDEVDKND
jgi:hypothetical protein